MSAQQQKQLLDKINALYHSLFAGQQPVSRLEKDLMLDLIRQLYDSFLDFSAPPTDLPVTPPAVAPPPIPIPQPKPEPAPVSPPPVAPIPASIPAPEVNIPAGMEPPVRCKNGNRAGRQTGRATCERPYPGLVHQRPTPVYERTFWQRPGGHE